jgi:hypothetical protein
MPAVPRNGVMSEILTAKWRSANQQNAKRKCPYGETEKKTDLDLDFDFDF